MEQAMNQFVTVGLGVLAGAALLEVALLPAVAIGGAALLAPKYLHSLRRRREAGSASLAGLPIEAPPTARDKQALAVLQRLGVSQALAKTITFRIVVTTLDFTTNYVVTGSAAVAAGVSTLGLVVGPVLYFVHETAWNYFARSEMAVALPGGLVISRRLAKTITFRTVGTVIDFGVNYAGTGEVATAAILTAFGFVVGPFVYLGHEMAWDYVTGPRQPRLEPPPTPKLLPAPAVVA
jgi:uncharacterized membrane protein